MSEEEYDTLTKTSVVKVKEEKRKEKNFRVVLCLVSTQDTGWIGSGWIHHTTWEQYALLSRGKERKKMGEVLL